MRIINRNQVESLISYEDQIKTIEALFADYGSTRISDPSRVVLWVPEHEAFMGAMPGYVPHAGAMGMKLGTVFGGFKSWSVQIILYDVDNSGGVLAIMDGEYITEARTAAASAVATGYLARSDSSVLGIIGAGRQGRSHLKAISKVRPIERVKVYNRSEPNLTRFMAFAGKEFPALSVEAVDTPRQAAEGADIIVTATTSPTPVLERNWIAPGTHINAIGNFNPQAAEIPADVVQAAKVVLDTEAGCLAEAGEILLPLAQGIITRDHVHGDLGGLCSGSVPGRTNENEITLFKGVGVAVMDIAVGMEVYKRAVEKEVGVEVGA